MLDNVFVFAYNVKHVRRVRKSPLNKKKSAFLYIKHVFFLAVFDISAILGFVVPLLVS